MATAGDGRAPYESSGAGGKFRKRPFRRSAPATPYERPPTALRNTNPGLLTKLVDPASRLIYAGAHKLFGVFRKRLPPLSLQGPPGVNEEPQNVSQEAGQNNSVGLLKLEADQDGNAANISAATGISELEQMLKQKTFTRSEIQHLTALLHSRTTDSPSDYVAERNGAKPHSSPSPLLRLEASTSGSMKKHGDNRDNFHASVSTPFVSSKVIEEETPSPAELAKAYMGIRTTKAAPSPLGLTSQDSKLINNVTSLQKTPITSIAPKTANCFKGLENGFLTPRSRGRSAMYSMARTPYSRSPLNFNQKGIMSETTLTSSQSLKRRSSVLDDDFGYGVPLRRTRQKANLLLQSRDKRELGYTTSQQPTLLRSEPEENGHTTMRESTPVSIPAKSTQTATKIFQQLERLSPKSPTKLTSNMLHGQALRSLEKVDSPKFLPTSHDTQKSEIQHRDNGESTSRGKEEFEENGARKFPVPFNMLTTVNGDMGVSKKESAQIFNGEIGVSVKESAQIYNGETGVSVKESAQIVTIDDSTSKLPPEPPQKKRAFRMSAPEDSWELDDDDDDDIHVNGHVSIPPVENNKPEASSVANKAVSADIIESTAPPEVSKTSATVEATLVVPEVIPVAKSPEQVELKESEKATPPPQIDGFLGGNVIDEGLGFKFPTSSPSTFNTQTSVLPQSTLQKDKVTPTEKVSPFPFSANKLSEFKPKESLDPKPINSTSVFSSDTKNGQFKVSNKDENGNDQKLEDIPAATSASAVFSFASSAKNSSGPTMTPDSSPSILSSSTPFPASGSNTNTLFNNTTSNIDPASTSIATSSVFSTSAPPPVFSFGSAKATTSMAETSNTNAKNEKEPKSTINSSLFATTIAPSGGGLFGLSSPAATSSSTTTTNGGALFGFSSPAATSSSTTTTNGGALFGFSSAAATSSSTTTTNGGALFGFSSAAATSSSTMTTNGGALFGLSSPAATSSSTTNTTNGGALFGFGSTAATATTTSGGALFGFGSTATTSTTTTTTASGGLFGFSSLAATSTATAQSQGSFFNAASGSQSNTQTSSPVTQAVPFSFSSSSSPFGSSAPAFGSSPTFGISSVPSTLEGKSGNSTSGSTASIFGSSWQSPTSSVFSFGASSAPTPSSTTAPITFGAPNTGASTGSSMFSFTTSGPTKPSFGAPSQVFGNPAPAIANNNDQMSMEDSMAEDSMQTPSPVSPFGQAAPVAAPGFMFGSATPAPPQSAASFQFGVQPNQAPPQNPFQSSSVEFNAGGGSFSLGSGGDKSGRRVVRINKSKNRRK